MSEWLKERGLNRTAHNALEWANSKITSGELMVVKTARIEGAKRACSSCGVEWPLLAIPAIGDHCICGAKIIP